MNSVKTYAKINLTLDITGKLSNGYHSLSSVMQTVSLYDVVEISKNETQKNITVRSNAKYIPQDERNHAVMAAKAFFEYTGISGSININLIKKIPVGAGLAGGSGNAAGTLCLLNKIYDAGLSNDQLRAIGVKIGADVPFCVEGGTCLAEGVGEILTPLSPMPDCVLLLAKFGRGASTREMFAAYDQMKSPLHPPADKMIDALEKGDLNAVAKNLGNSLEAVTARFVPEVLEIKQMMLGGGAMGAVMSGSGTTVYGIYKSKSVAEETQRELRKRYRNIKLFICKPVNV
ncbi:MAG: 4-(cytidine 5'-diphospho)-2-C-methyl-D-erythritol kinase [Bacillota bacterium]|nr:4-(cytidine 5'-diphospho)-2-C-methyl-D-erythritol kinase [Bacillota bacterium]